MITVYIQWNHGQDYERLTFQSDVWHSIVSGNVLAGVADFYFQETLF